MAELLTSEHKLKRIIELEKTINEIDRKEDVACFRCVSGKGTISQCLYSN